MLQDIATVTGAQIISEEVDGKFLVWSLKCFQILAKFNLQTY